MAEPVKRYSRPALLAALGLALVACGHAQGQPGDAARVPGTSATPPPATSAAPSGPPSLADLDPCALLSPADRSTAGVTVVGKPKTIGAAKACDWTVPATFGVTVTVDPKNGVADLEVARATGTKTVVGSHQALRVADRKAGDGTCAVLLGIGAGGSVQIDVANTTFSDTAQACRRADTVAGLVEPKLP
ncbi:DUF3558 domain-containing protein [Amycolatopsis samaneae]|uniref:DUF3558 domain-containing protein n=1 Tax=Amycolatopsis samaneae TaxID=664691 RepID=A0ABW5G959_9PSEU